MSIDFSKLKSIDIPEGKVTKVECDGKVLWSAIKPTTTLILHLIVTGEAIDYTTAAGTYTYTTTSSNPKIDSGSDSGVCFAMFGEGAYVDAANSETAGEHRLFSSAMGYFNGFATSENGSPEFYYKELTAGETYELWAEVYC